MEGLSGDRFFLQKFSLTYSVMELYFYEDCEYCQRVFETIVKLKKNG